MHTRTDKLNGGTGKKSKNLESEKKVIGKTAAEIEQDGTEYKVLLVISERLDLKTLMGKN